MSSSSSHDLRVFLEQVTSEMASEYKRIYAKAPEDPGTAGDQGEENWAVLLREWLPSGYHVRTKGRLIGVDGALSPQIDVLVLKPSYPQKLLEKKMWLASGVAAVFECKTTLTAAHVHDSYRRCRDFKALIKPSYGTPRKELQSTPIYGLLAHSHSWKAENSTPVENIDNAIRSAKEQLSHPREEVDILCVANLATWTRAYVAFQQGGTLLTSMARFPADTSDLTPEFRPVGTLLAFLWRGLGWMDPSVRDIADYFRLANITGSGVGACRGWPASIYSEDIQKIIAGRFTNGIPWDEWSIAGF